MALGEKLGKLSIAILENFVEDKLGKKFVDELRAPTDRAIAVATALEQTENRFKKEFDDKELVRAIFDDLPADKKILGAAVGKFYDHPTDPDFQQSLEQILMGAFKNISRERINKAVDFYLEMLTEELALADETFRENARALSDLRVVQILKRVEQHLANQSSVIQEHLLLRSLHQLPPAPADFTGREEQLQQVLEALAQHKGAAISGLTGMGGIGKTTLGLVAAHRIEGQYPDAQIFLDLKGVTEPLTASDALRHIILSFEPKADLREANEDQLAALYQSFLADKKVLVFMDNAREAAQVRALIPPESCALIVTSRWHFTLPNMDPLRLDVLPENQAIDLLHELCKRISGTAKDIAELCGYLPLALRIAGTFLAEHNDWTPKEYTDRLKAKRLSALKGEEQDERFDLENVLGESYEQLTQDEQKYWRMLAVFPASFKREAAAAVWELEEDAARDLLSKFNRMSLLDYDEKTERYSLHDLLSTFALTQMHGNEEQEADYRYTVHYINVMIEANELYSEGGKKVLQGLHLLDSEWTHILNAQRWSKTNSDELCNEFPNAGFMILNLRLHPGEYISWLEAGLIAAKNLDNKEYQGLHLGNLGLSYINLGEMRKAIEFYEQALAIAREIGDRRTEGNWLGNLGLAYACMGDARKAIEFYEQALAIAREIGDRRGEGSALGNLGNVYKDLGDAHKAIEFYKQQLVIVREIGDRRGEGNALGNLGNAYEELGDARKAIEHHEKALVVIQEIGDRLAEDKILGNLGNAYHVLGETRMVIEFYEQALVIARQIGDRRGEGVTLFNLGDELYGIGEKEKGILFVRQAIEIFTAIESPNAQKARDTLKEWGGGD